MLLCPDGAPTGPGTPGWADAFPGFVRQVAERVDPPVMPARHTFEEPVDGTVRAVVLAETWWWIDPPPSVEESDTEGPMWVTVTAEPSRLTVDPGDGTGAMDDCESWVAYNRDESYYDQIPGADRGACVHVYEDTHDHVTATVTVVWSLSYDGFAPGLGNVSGDLDPLERTTTVTFPVTEIQSVIVNEPAG